MELHGTVHPCLRWNKVMDSAFPARAAILQGSRTHPACCYRGSSDVLCRLRSVLTGEEYMRSVPIALICTLLAACTAVAQEAPRSRGPTDPNPPQQAPLDETKSGSRALTGSDDIPAYPQHRTPLLESTSNPISSPCRQPRSNNQTLLRGNASLPQTHAGQSLPGIFFCQSSLRMRHGIGSPQLVHTPVAPHVPGVFDLRPFVAFVTSRSLSR
jgi:hypothetical protein